MSEHEDGEPKGHFGDRMQELSFNQTACGSQATDSAFTKIKLTKIDVQVLRAKVEEVIKEFNLAMELSEERMERMRKTVMNEAKALVAKLEEAEARRTEELGWKISQLIEKLENDLGVIFLTKKI